MTQLADMIRTVDSLLEDVFRLPVQKALDPNDPQDFDKIADALATALKGKTGAAEAVALDEAIRTLDVDWKELSDAQKDVVVNAAKSALSVPDTTIEGITEEFEANAQHVGLSTKASAKRQFGLNIQVSLDKQDRKILGALAMSQANFVRDEYGKRQELFGNKAKEIVLGGLENGLDRFAIAARLKSDLTLQQAKRSENYWTVIAASFANRSRTYANLASYHEAKITRFTFEAILDESTSKVCRFMHGRSFSVRSALAAYQATESDPDPEAVKQHQPWLQVGRDQDGQEYIYPRGQKGNSLGTIVESGMGQVDNAGKYKNAASDADLEAAGIMTPPLHGHCRSTIIPDTSIEFEEAPAFPSGGPVMAPSPLLEPPDPLIQPAGQFTEEDITIYEPELDVISPYEQTAKPQVVQIPVTGGGEVEAVIPPVDKKALALEKLQALIRASADSDAAKYGLLSNPFWQEGKNIAQLEAKQQLIDEAFAASTAKKVGLFVKSMRSTKEEIDPEKVAMYIQNPKLLAKAEIRVVKIGTEVYVVEGHEAVVAAKMLDKQQVKVRRIILAEYEKQLKEAAAQAAASAKEQEKPKPVKVRDKTVALPVAPPPPKKETLENLLHEKTAPAAGSNEGGFYRGADGVARYVKFYSDPAQAHGEALANAMYGALGFASPQAVVVQQDGKHIYAAQLLEGRTLASSGALTQASAREFMRGFVADVLIGNWDAAGASGDNAFLLSDGRVARIDNGGSFLLRAKAGRKPVDVLGKISEWERFFQSSNPGYSRIAQAAGYSSPEDFKEVVVAGIRNVQALRKTWGGWQGFVDKYGAGLAPADKKAVVDMLEARSKLLDGKLAELTRPEAEKLPALPGRTDFPGWRAPPIPKALAPVPGLRVRDLPVIRQEEAWPKEQYGRLPSGQSKEEFQQQSRERLAGLEEDARNGIRRFTASDYGDMRYAQMEEQRTGREVTSRAGSLARAAERAYRTCIPTPMTVWRSISATDAVIEAMISNQGEFRLGEGNLGAMSSSTWRPGLAKSWPGKVIFQIHQQSGLAVDVISSNAGEDEILISRNAVFRVLGAARDEHGNTYIEIEEIAATSVAQSAPAKKPRRSRKAPST